VPDDEGNGGTAGRPEEARDGGALQALAGIVQVIGEEDGWSGGSEDALPGLS
jgi:hypothetical protein